MTVSDASTKWVPFYIVTRILCLCLKVKPLLDYLQASSPIRTLDELHVSEVVSTSFFPSIMEGDLNRIINQDSAGHCIKSGLDLVISSIADRSNLGMPEGGCNNVFGLRKKHRCYVVRARARSFLYHQVRIMPFHVWSLPPYFILLPVLRALFELFYFCRSAFNISFWWWENINEKAKDCWGLII